ncbi:four helix bundle protein [Geobacillus stearothermophilus]|uniref:four helix bundle protein n=1 Tax=Geobacillus stearothermophilus TaxID=1422 RepID=UPI001F1A24AE|nr:four helix bundle protein [Geobacillus stearothermophilus]
MYKKTELLLHETYPVLRNFPKAEKFSLCQEIKQAFYSLLKYIILANSLYQRGRRDEIWRTAI